MNQKLAGILIVMTRIPFQDTVMITLTNMGPGNETLQTATAILEYPTPMN